MEMEIVRKVGHLNDSITRKRPRVKAVCGEILMRLFSPSRAKHDAPICSCNVVVAPRAGIGRAPRPVRSKRTNGEDAGSAVEEDNEVNERRGRSAD